MGFLVKLYLHLIFQSSNRVEAGEGGRSVFLKNVDKRGLIHNSSVNLERA